MVPNNKLPFLVPPRGLINYFDAASYGYWLWDLEAVIKIIRFSDDAKAVAEATERLTSGKKIHYPKMTKKQFDWVKIHGRPDPFPGSSLGMPELPNWGD